MGSQRNLTKISPLATKQWIKAFNSLHGRSTTEIWNLDSLSTQQPARGKSTAKHSGENQRPTESQRNHREANQWALKSQKEYRRPVNKRLTSRRVATLKQIIEERNDIAQQMIQSRVSSIQFIWFTSYCRNSLALAFCVITVIVYVLKKIVKPNSAKSEFMFY